jgi:transcriptional regulator with XRE-family HTH domain
VASLAEILNAKIGRNRVSKASVAAQLHVTERTIENYLKGARQPKIEELVKLSKILDFSLNELAEHDVPYRTHNNTRLLTKNNTMNSIDYQSEYIQSLKERIEDLQQRIKEINGHCEDLKKTNEFNSNSLLLNQLSMLAWLKAIAKRNAELNGGSEGSEAELNRLGNYVAEYLRGNHGTDKQEDN